jgi:hypothetical protein
MSRGGGSAKEGAAYHLISRFVAQEWFIQSSAERSEYLRLLGRALAATSWRCFCFAVMSSHIHLGLLAGSDPLAGWLRPMHTDFAKWLNECRGRIGAVFVKGPNFIEYQRVGVPHLINYVHLNPVRAGVVGEPHESDWTSHRAYVGLDRPPRWLDIECGLELARRTLDQPFATWTEATRVERADLDAFRAEPRAPRGRPRKQAGQDDGTRFLHA